MRRHTRYEAPVWGPGTGHIRIVIEDADGAAAYVTGVILREAGFETLICGGPETLPKHRCSLVSEGRCALIDGADAVYCALRLSSDENRAVLTALRSRHPFLPIVVEATPAEADKLGHVLDGCTVVPFPPLRSTILTAVDAALGGKWEAGVR